MKKLLIAAAFVFATGLSFAAEYKLGANDCCYQGGKAPAVKNGDIEIGGYAHFWSKKAFTYNPAKKYSLYADIRTDYNGAIPGIAIGFAYFDSKDQFIKTAEYAIVPKTFTELAKPVSATDTVLYLKAVPGYRHQKGYGYVVAFEAKEDGSDVPTKKISSKVKSVKIANGIMEVTVAKPVFTSLPAGSKVRLHYDISFYQPVPEWTYYHRAKKEWKTFGGTRKIPSFVKKFRPVIVYYNHSRDPKKTFLVRNFKLIEE